MSYPTQVVAIEAPVTHYLYDEKRVNISLLNMFLRHLNSENPPHTGEDFVISPTDWQDALLTFGIDYNLLPEIAGTHEEAIKIRDRIFGKPKDIQAGSAVANSVSTMFGAKVDGVPLATGTYLTGINEVYPDNMFANTPVDTLIYAESHIIPIEDSHISITVSNREMPLAATISPEMLNQVMIDRTIAMVILGSNMHLADNNGECLDTLLEKLEATSPNIKERPTLVLTAASQSVAESTALKVALQTAPTVAPVIVSANTGELRRLLDMDTDWRKPHERKWWYKETNHGYAQLSEEFAIAFNPNTPEGKNTLITMGWKKLEGIDLERAKLADADYQAAKLKANEQAYLEAYTRIYEGQYRAPVTFVVTNGGKGVHVISSKGYAENYVPPKPPNGIVNTVGGGDAFLGGFLLGHMHKLPEADCVELGFICAGHVIGQDAARLAPKSCPLCVQDVLYRFMGLPAYLQAGTEKHKRILTAFIKNSAESLLSNPHYPLSKKVALNSPTPPGAGNG